MYVCQLYYCHSYQDIDYDVRREFFCSFFHFSFFFLKFIRRVSYLFCLKTILQPLQSQCAGRSMALNCALQMAGIFVPGAHFSHKSFLELKWYLYSCNKSSTGSAMACLLLHYKCFQFNYSSKYCHNNSQGSRRTAALIKRGLPKGSANQ